MKPLTDWLHHTPRYRKLCYTLAVLGLTMLTGCHPAPQKPLRVATILWPGYESIHLAQSLGYINPQSIRLVEMAHNGQASMALRNATADAAMLTLDETLYLLQDGVDLRVVLVMDISNGADVVMARPEITTLQDLRGKRVAVENGGVGAVMLDAMLEAANLKIGDIIVVSKTGNEHTDAYIKDMTDAIVTFEPMRSTLLKQGAHILFDSSRIPGRIIDVLAVRADVMSEHKQALLSLVAAHFKALDYQTSQPQDAARRLAPFLGVKENEVSAQYDGLKLPTLADNQALLAGTSPILKTSTANLANLMLQHKLLQRSVNTEHIAEPMFLPQEIK